MANIEVADYQNELAEKNREIRREQKKAERGRDKAKTRRGTAAKKGAEKVEAMAKEAGNWPPPDN